MTKPYRICSRCIMDTTDPDIVFESQGCCNHCTAWFARPAIYNLPAAGTRAVAGADRGADEAAWSR